MAGSTDGWHESLRADHRPTEPSDRAFGFTLSSVLAVLGAWALFQERIAGAWELGIAALFLVVTLSWPGLLRPLNRFWALIGVFLNAIASPVVMAVVFYGVVTPVGVVLRMLGRDPLRRRIDPALQSYWIKRPPAGRHQTSMKNQF